MQRLLLGVRVLHAVAATGCGAVLCLVVARQEAAMSLPQAAVFYAVPGTLLVYFVFGAVARGETSLKLLLLPFSIAVGLLLAELFTSLRPEPERWPDVVAARHSPDPRTKVEVIRDLRDSGTTAYAEFSPWTLRDHPMVLDEGPVVALAPAPSHTLLVVCNEGSGWVTWETDDHGFRSRSGNETAGPAQIALIGDSFTLGECVNEDETVAGRLRRRWRFTRNFGVAGSGPLHQLAVLREYASRYRPRVVVWIYYEANDLSDFEDELASPLLTRYLEAGYRAGLPERQPEVDRWLTARLDSVYRTAVDRAALPSPESSSGFSLMGFLKLRRLRETIGFPVAFPQPVPTEALARVFRLGSDLVAGWGGTTLFVYLPAYARYRFLGGEALVGRAAVLAVVDSLGIPILDLHSHFRAAVPDPRDLWVHPNGHLGPRGYAVVADAIASRISALLPP
jgi:hypothetical protein